MPPRPAHLGNLERVLFPADGITKADLLGYYRDVAPALLPHLAGRPFVQRRMPTGIAGKHFFEKDAPAFMPDWVHRAELPAAPRAGSARPTVVYPVLDDVPSLLWFVSIGS